MKISKYINTTRMVVTVLILGTFGFLWTSHYPDAPYGMLVTLLLGALGGIGGKRLVEKIKGVDSATNGGGGFNNNRAIPTQD